MTRVLLLLLIVAAFMWQGDVWAKSGNAKKDGSRQWTVEDTISAAIGYSPVVKREEEAIKSQRENVNQAKAGHLPRVDVEGSGGAATLPVSKYN